MSCLRGCLTLDWALVVIIITQTFRRALTASVDSCAGDKECPFNGVTKSDRVWGRCRKAMFGVWGCSVYGLELSCCVEGVCCCSEVRDLYIGPWVKSSLSEVGSSACTPLLSKHRAVSPGQVGSHRNVGGVCQLRSKVSLLQHRELVLPSMQSGYDGAGTVVVVGLGPCAMCTLNVVCSPGLTARIKAVQGLNLLSDTRCVLFVRAFVNIEKMNIVPAWERFQLVHFFLNVQTNVNKTVFPFVQVFVLTIKQFTFQRQIPYIFLKFLCLKRLAPVFLSVCCVRKWGRWHNYAGRKARARG